jgi:DNA polymerase-3 subunit gamma/tau
MLGLADRAQVVDLFEAAMRGDVPASFSILRNQYDAGADPAVVLAELAAFSHVVTRLKLIPDAAKDPALTEVERSRGLDFAGKLTVRTLSRAWQILLKGVPEVQAANRPVAAAEMVLVRLAYAADLPTPDEALRALPRRHASSRWRSPAFVRCAALRRALVQPRPRGLAARPAAAPSAASRGLRRPCACAASRTWSPSPASSATSCSRRRSNGTCASCASRRAASSSTSRKAAAGRCERPRQGAPGLDRHPLDGGPVLRTRRPDAA